MTDIVFCNVPIVQTRKPFSAPAILKSVVEKHGYSAKTIDFNSEFNTGEETELNNFWMFGNGEKNIIDVAAVYTHKWAKHILQHKPKWIGISVFAYTCQIATEMLCLSIKAIDTDVKIVLGGNGMATGGINGDFTWPEKLRQAKTIEAYIRSEAEESIINLLQGNLTYPGINQNAVPTQINDLDKLPIPNYDDYIFENYERKALPITGSRGCVRQCTFCDIHSHWKKFVYRTGESICNEMKELSAIHKIYHFKFTDSLINGSMKAYRDFISNLSKHNKKTDHPITWSGQFIARPASQMTEQDWKMTQESGGEDLAIGVETGSDKVRNDMQKKFTNKDLDFCVEMAFKFNIKIALILMTGYPTETQEDFDQTLEMFSRYQKFKQVIEPVLGTTVAILPRTPLQDFAKKNNFVFGNTENEWWWHQNPNLTLKERLRRRILLGMHCKSLGYKFDEEKELRTMRYIWKNHKLNKFVDKSKLYFSQSDDRNSQYYS